MSNKSHNRPSLAKKHTRKTDEHADDELSRGVRLTIDGETYEVRVGDVTARITRELRARTGMGFLQLLDALSQDSADIDLLSSFVWVARRLRGEQIDLDDVEVSYAAMLADGFDVSEAGAEEDDGSPEA